MAISPEAYAQIARLKVFSESALADLAVGALERSVVRREMVLNKGDSLPFLPFLIEGRLQGIDFTLDGREVGLYFVGPGEFFGELAMVDRLPVPETVIAIAKKTGGFVMALLLAFYLIFSAVIPASALEGSPAAAALVIKADVLYWEGEELVVKEFSGHEERLLVTPETKIEGVVGGRLKSGD